MTTRRLLEPVQEFGHPQGHGGLPGPGRPGKAHVQVGPGGAGPDVVFDGGGELGAAAFEMIADGGRFSAHGAASGGFAPNGADQAARRGVTLRGIEQVQFGPGEHERLAGQSAS